MTKNIQIQNTEYSNHDWLSQLITKTVKNKPNLPFLIFSKSVAQLRKEFTLPFEFLHEILTYSHLVAIYLQASTYKRERLLYYHTDKCFRAIPSDDFTCRLLCKMKLLAIDNNFDQAAEQDMGLGVGIINRPQFKEHYTVKFIDEKIYYNMKVKFAYNDGRELAHVIVFRPTKKDDLGNF